ncbi:alpha/beta hydrolase [Desulfitobacterium hafniense]|nr:alpha/beta hydrolase [Desulfitobacterium hafniense]EHL05743.1 hydrolase, alpha/beta domain protein [Desulfitobacterium hafniense DP7]MEA5021492.1 alpha/beta hydrolase [Desulfitobacterium hafniense]CDX00972.1 Alpha/beta hydrolase fold-3 domain protein [Desulfitobacterium hafniense]
MENPEIKKSPIKPGFWAALVLTFLVAMLLTIILENRWYSYAVTGGVASALLTIRIKLSPQGLRYGAVWLLCLCLLALSVAFGRSALSVSLTGDLFNKGFRAINHVYARSHGSAIFHDTMLNGQREPYDFESWQAPQGYRNSKISLSNSSGYLLTRDNGNHKKVIYQLHGGGYIGVFNKIYNDRALQYSACYDGADVFSLDYRTAPDHLYPAALEDALEGYQWLLEQGYPADQIILCGDSAGGGLALATTLYLRDHNQALPELLILSSPWADLAQTGESYSTNIQKDAFFGLPDADMKPQYPIPILYAGDHDLHDPYLSPVYADYANMPPMLIQAGGDEILLSDSQTIAAKAKEAGTEVKFLTYEGMYHAFYIVTPHFREGKDAWAEIERFIREHASSGQFTEKIKLPITFTPERSTG